MQAILCTRPGGPDDLVLAELPVPVAGAGEAVVSIKAVGLNFFDTLIIAGKYQTKPPMPFSPGGEFAGVIDSVGAGVTLSLYSNQGLGRFLATVEMALRLKPFAAAIAADRDAAGDRR